MKITEAMIEDFLKFEPSATKDIAAYVLDCHYNCVPMSMKYALMADAYKLWQMGVE